MKRGQEVMETCLEKDEAIPEEIKFVGDNQEVPDEEVVVEMIEAHENRTRDHAVPAQHKDCNQTVPAAAKI
jgi:hypothetical protein